MLGKLEYINLSDAKLCKAFSQKTHANLKNIAYTNQLGIESVLAPVLTSIAHVMSGCSVHVNSHREKFILYTGLFANKCSSRKQALGLAQQAILEVERANGIGKIDSRLANSFGNNEVCTFLCLSGLLIKLKSIISLENKGDDFLHSLSDSSCDSHSLKQLFYGFTYNNIKAQDKRINYVKDPVVNICLRGDIKCVEKLLLLEKQNSREELKLKQNESVLGLFLIFVPEPIDSDIFHKFNIYDINQPSFSLSTILYFISEINKLQLEFTFDREARNTYNNYYILANRIVQEAKDCNDFYIANTYSKVSVYLLRLCGIIHCLNASVELLSNIPDCYMKNLTQNFMSGVGNSIEKEIDMKQFAVIGKQSVECAIHLMNYLLKIKFSLSENYVNELNIRIHYHTNYCINSEVRKYLGRVLADRNEKRKAAIATDKLRHRNNLHANYPQYLESFLQPPNSYEIFSHRSKCQQSPIKSTRNIFNIRRFRESVSNER